MASLPPVLSIPRFGSVEKPEPDMIELIRYAGDSGVTFLHTSDVYGPHMNEILIGKNFLSQVGEMKKLVEEGKVKYIGLSEASASII